MPTIGILTTYMYLPVTAIFVLPRHCPRTKFGWRLLSYQTKLAGAFYYKIKFDCWLHPLTSHHNSYHCTRLHPLTEPPLQQMSLCLQVLAIWTAWSVLKMHWRDIIMPKQGTKQPVPSTVTQALARLAIFGVCVMKRCTPSGSSTLPALLRCTSLNKQFSMCSPVSGILQPTLKQSGSSNVGLLSSRPVHVVAATILDSFEYNYAYYYTYWKPVAALSSSESIMRGNTLQRWRMYCWDFYLSTVFQKACIPSIT